MTPTRYPALAIKTAILAGGVRFTSATAKGMRRYNFAKFAVPIFEKRGVRILLTHLLRDKRHHLFELFL